MVNHKKLLCLLVKHKAINNLSYTKQDTCKVTQRKLACEFSFVIDVFRVLAAKPQ